MIAWLKQQWARLRGERPARTEKEKSGFAGETVAARFLAKERGMTILMRNWRSPRDRRDEIDIVCRSPDGVIVFVEVRTRTGENLFAAYGSIDRRKKAVLKRAAREYLRGLGPRRHELSYRFDVVIVQQTGDGRHVPHHFENVPLFSKGKHI